MKAKIKAGDKGWVIGYNVAHPVTVKRIVHRSSGETNVHVELEWGATLAVFPDLLLTTRKEVEKAIRGRIRDWQKALKTFKEDVR